MWAILKKRAQGMVLLVNSDAPDPLEERAFFLEEFRELYDRGGVVIGITRSDVKQGPSVADIADEVERTNPGLVIPVFTVDPRDKDQMQNLLLALVVNIEMRAAFGASTVRETV
jgi:signal recognition particle receptor subunit beta